MPAPGCWNGSLLLFAHGYVSPDQPVGIPENQLTLNGVSLPVLVNQLGFAFALSSYRKNGLAIREGVEDTEDLVNIFTAQFGRPNKTYLTGASEGGLVAALSSEQLPSVYTGALPACGPIGDFHVQLNYIGDFRVVFDYFFPGLIPGSPVTIPAEVMTDWTTLYVPKILAAFQSNPSATAQLLMVTKFPQGPDANTTQQAMVELLWYNVFATNDAITELGGQPFDNHGRIYFGSSNDILLNLKVERFRADPVATAEIAAHYQTKGKLSIPSVTLHTLADPIVPWVHEPLYTLKTILAGSASEHVTIPAASYGHCNFQEKDLLLALGVLLLK